MPEFGLWQHAAYGLATVFNAVVMSGTTPDYVLQLSEAAIRRWQPLSFTTLEITDADTSLPAIGDRRF